LVAFGAKYTTAGVFSIPLLSIENYVDTHGQSEVAASYSVDCWALSYYPELNMQSRSCTLTHSEQKMPTQICTAVLTKAINWDVIRQQYEPDGR